MSNLQTIEYAGFNIKQKVLRGAKLFYVVLPQGELVESGNVSDCNVAIDNWIELNF